MTTISNKMDSAEVFSMFETLKGLIVKQSEKPTEKVNQSVSKEDIEKIVHEKVSVMATFIELKIKQQTENQTNAINKKLDTLPVSGNGSFPQPKKIAFFGFEFLRTSVVIFILSLIVFWSLVMNIKQMDNYQALKAQNNQLTEYNQHFEKTEKEKSKKVK